MHSEIIDSHCHAWQRWPYKPVVPDPSRGSAANLLWAMSNAGVGRAVVICAAIGDNPDNSGDAMFAAAASGGRLVPFADIDCRWHDTHRKPGGVARLDALCDRLRPRGVTFYLNESEPADWLLSADGLAFLGAIDARGLILSLACGARQASIIAEAALRFPRLPILVHHLWRVRIGDDAALRLAVAAARAPNLIVKISGHGHGSDTGWDYPLPGMQAIARALCEAYGPERLVWGSDWPVCERFMTYRQALEIVRAHGPEVGPQARALMLGGTMAKLIEGWRPQ
jgi:predicted TIM-barrel fold metal-dependent hydrolase